MLGYVMLGLGESTWYHNEHPIKRYRQNLFIFQDKTHSNIIRNYNIDKGHLLFGINLARGNGN